MEHYTIIWVQLSEGMPRFDRDEPNFSFFPKFPEAMYHFNQFIQATTTEAVWLFAPDWTLIMRGVSGKYV